jgi:hypothetical protein
MMRTDPDISSALEFMDEHIASLAELELLVALVEAPSRWWDATVLSRELGIPKHVGRTVLERFARSNLLEIRFTDDVRYQFRPGTPELHGGAAALVAAYRTKPIVLIQHLTRQTRRSVRDFADAFRLRRNGRG